VSAAIRALLANVVDYAGLYPPASLDVPTAARNYSSYLAAEDRWMLGRFVVGVAKLPELRAVIQAIRPRESAWPVAVVAPDAAAATGVIRAVDDGAVKVESVEVKATTVAEVTMLGKAATRARDVYVEVAVNPSLESLLDANAAAKLRAKIRTGGVTTDAFPPSASVVRFLRGCTERGIAFKATAGLHHPLRGSYRLTYDRDAASGSMFGFLNVFLAAALIRGGLSDDDAHAVLEESDETAFVVGDQTIAWRDHVVDLDAITSTRARFATSFGSCSFREPVDELPFPLISA
jgi:hypothetical protein